MSIKLFLKHSRKFSILCTKAKIINESWCKKNGLMSKYDSSIINWAVPSIKLQKIYLPSNKTQKAEERDCVCRLQQLTCLVAHVLCLEVILKKKTFFKLTVQTHDLRHMTKAMLGTSQHNHLTICPLTSSNIILNIGCHVSASRQHRLMFPSKWYLHPN